MYVNKDSLDGECDLTYIVSVHSPDAKSVWKNLEVIKPYYQQTENMETLVILYLAKIALALMLVPLYRDYKRRQLRHARVQAWRSRKLGTQSSQTLF